MTESALQFLGPATLSAITGSRPATGFWTSPRPAAHQAGPMGGRGVHRPGHRGHHGRLAHGLSEDLLSAVVLATRAPIVAHRPCTLRCGSTPPPGRNLASLLADGCRVVGPARGALAAGDVARGGWSTPRRSWPPWSRRWAAAPWRLAGAGQRRGTREPIDPVRFVGNRSSGKMGNALAEEAAARGAAVALVDHDGAPGRRASRWSASRPRPRCRGGLGRAPGCDVAVLAAAVADFRPAQPASAKLRRADGPPQLVLEPTPDILAGVASMQPRPFLVGFAAETGPVEGAVGQGAGRRGWTCSWPTTSARSGPASGPKATRSPDPPRRQPGAVGAAPQAAGGRPVVGADRRAEEPGPS